AQRIRDNINALEGTNVPAGNVDITLYRDDWTRKSTHPIVQTTEILFDLDDKQIILTDDVLYTGRTTRAAMDAIIDFGRPKRIRVAALVDRGGRELPILANFVGIQRKARPGETINVYLKEREGVDRAVVEKTDPRSNPRVKSQTT
ncbi:MAG: bifunctional pyr operon transcriptional regulator/uracil phosphoribosyltransferase PyrR, partial [Deltaproteobacteria bacterium]|nr:bifunctional pyr operon transcriptional regulator/uracil phosphoribosyltransferase PyrR [Deltaproteobacteria bacterium]